MTLAYGVVASIGAHTVVAAWHGRTRRTGARPLGGLAGGCGPCSRARPR
ncbi:hypothetical protein [Cryptosporangium sp. NPDC048952]